MGMDTYPPQLETGKGGSECVFVCQYLVADYLSEVTMSLLVMAR